MASYTRMQGELISFEAADKVELEGMLCAPFRSKWCMIHVHGMTDTFYGLKMVDNMSSVALKNDMNFFAMNTRGSGTITSFFKLREHLVSRIIGTAFENFKECTLDIDAAIKMLKERGYKYFMLSGHSTGCQKITYYQYKRKKKSVQALILLAPSDDYNYQIKLLGKRKWKIALDTARKLVRAGKGKELLSPDIEPSYFSAKRYYELYRPGSVEGNLFNYEKDLKEVSSLKVPIFAVFGSKEDFAAMPPSRMLKILQKRLHHPYSKTVLIKDADHCFCLQEEEVEAAVDKWLKHMVW